MSIKRLAWLFLVVLLATPSANAGSVTGLRDTSTVRSIAASVAMGVDTLQFGNPKKKRPIVTPEPASLLLFGTGMLGLAAGIRRKKDRNSK